MHNNNEEQGTSEMDNITRSLVDIQEVKDANYMSPNSSVIQNEIEIPSVKKPTNIKQFNF